MKRSWTQSGFSLIELMVAIAVLTILLSLAVPSFSTVIKNNRMTTLTNQLVLDLNLARSEAVKRGATVILCRSAAPATAGCGGSTQDWTTGWIIFASQDSNTTYDNGTDIIIKRSEVSSPGMRIMANTAADTAIAFNPDGFKATTGSSVFALCDDRDDDGSYDKEYGRQITVIGTGRPGLTTGTTTSPSNFCAP